MDAANQFLVLPAESPAELAAVRELFLEYWRARKLSLAFFSFDRELAELPGAYAPPEGRLLLASWGGEPVGCVALRRMEPAICEIKRLYIKPQFRGRGWGRILTEAVIQEARGIGYRKIRLDTIGPSMQDAMALYERMGFREISAYHHNPLEGVKYLELDL